MQPIKTYSTRLEADIAALELEAAGITAIVLGIGVGMEGGMGGVRLMVQENDVEAALRILGDR